MIFAICYSAIFILLAIVLRMAGAESHAIADGVAIFRYPAIFRAIASGGIALVIVAGAAAKLTDRRNMIKLSPSDPAMLFLAIALCAAIVFCVYMQKFSIEVHDRDLVRHSIFGDEKYVFSASSIVEEVPKMNSQFVLILGNEQAGKAIRLSSSIQDYPGLRALVDHAVRLSTGRGIIVSR